MKLIPKPTTVHNLGQFNPYEVQGSHNDEAVDFGLLGCDSMYFCRWLPMFQKNASNHHLKD
jgi:hypothetical protein